MIYVDTSVVLAHLFAEDRRPLASFWTETLVSSRLLEYETWTRLRARKVTASRTEAAQEVIARISLPAGSASARALGLGVPSTAARLPGCPW